MQSTLGHVALADASLQALQVARMQVREHQFEWIAALIGDGKSCFLHKPPAALPPAQPSTTKQSHKASALAIIKPCVLRPLNRWYDTPRKSVATIMGNSHCGKILLRCLCVTTEKLLAEAMRIDKLVDFLYIVENVRIAEGLGKGVQRFAKFA